ncbi:hypothetical protein TNCV_4837811 [Trichonephila clavipes]|nr:hypothetical protein TNCV_4837811 [Trichonephila clavipes]
MCPPTAAMQVSIWRGILSICPLMVARVPSHTLLWVDYSRFVLWSSIYVTSNEIPQMFDGIQIWRVYRSGQGKFSNSVRLLKVHRSTCGLALSSWNTVLDAYCNKERKKGSITCTSKRSPVKRPPMCTRGILWSNIMRLEIKMPDIGLGIIVFITSISYRSLVAPFENSCLNEASTK